MLIRPISLLCSALLAVALAPPSTVRAQDGVSVEGTMPEDNLPALKSILDSALKQSPEMIQNEINIAQAKANVYNSDHPLWPSVSGGASYGDNKSSTVGGSSSTQKALLYNVGISQPIFQWGALANQSRIGRISLLISKRSYSEAYRQLATSIREQYLGLILKKLTIRNSRYQLDLAKAQLASMQNRLKQGTVSSGEIEAVSETVEDGSLNLERQEDDYATAMRSFQTMAGLKELTDDEIPLSLPRPSFNRDAASALLAGLLRDHARSTFQAQVYEMQIRQAELNYQVARVNLLPKLSASTGYQVSSSTTAFNSNISQSVIDSLTAYLNVSWQIFDGFATRGAKLSALESKRSSEQQLDSYIESTEEQAQHLNRILGISARYEDITLSRWQGQLGNLEEELRELKAGRVPQSAVDSLRASANDYELHNLSARVDLYSQWSEFVSIVGRDPALNNLPPSYVREKR